MKNRDYWMTPICFVWGLFYAWLVTWVANVIYWLENISIESLLGSVFWTDVKGLLFVIHAFVSMFFYIAVLPAAAIPISHVYNPWIRRFLIVAYAVSVITIIDPSVSSYLFSKPIESIVEFLRKDCYFHLMGGASLANLTWSDKISRLDYNVFHTYIVIGAILCLRNKDNFL